MNYSIRKSSKWIPLLSIHRGNSCAWLFISRDSNQYIASKISSTISCGLVTEFNQNTSNINLKNQVLITLKRNSASVFQSRSYVSLARRFGVRHSLYESTYRHYSQGSISNNKEKLLVKWFAALVSAGLAGGVIYKFLISDGASKDINGQSNTEKQKDLGHSVTKYPNNSKDIPENIPYLLIGGGTASFSAFRAIKAIDSTAKVLIITEEQYYPYMRPPLSKELILNKNNEAARTLSFTQWNGSDRSVYYEPNEFYVPCEELNDSNDGGVSVARGWKVIELNPDLQYVVLEDGKCINYNKCLLATGAIPKNLQILSNANPEIQKKVTLYRNLHDFLKLESIIEQGIKSIVIVGGGFNGSELACSLARRVMAYGLPCNLSPIHENLKETKQSVQDKFIQFMESTQRGTPLKKRFKTKFNDLYFQSPHIFQDSELQVISGPNSPNDRETTLQGDPLEIRSLPNMLDSRTENDVQNIGLNVTQIYKEDGNMAQVLPDYLSKWVTSKIQKEGIQLHRNTEVENVKLDNKKLHITTNTNESILADHVIVAAGVIPNTDLASSSGLETDKSLGGFLVNAELQARNNLYAAGDCACFYDKQFGRRRVEHHDHAVVSGRLAGENMTGAGKPFIHQSMFWSDLGPGLSYEAIGIVDSKLPTVSVFMDNPIEVESDKKKEETLKHSEKTIQYLKTFQEENEEALDNFHKGIIFYLNNEKVVGMVMWNLFNRISIARQILKSNVGLEDLKEAAKLFSVSESATE